MLLGCCVKVVCHLYYSLEPLEYKFVFLIFNLHILKLLFVAIGRCQGSIIAIFYKIIDSIKFN